MNEFGWLLFAGGLGILAWAGGLIGNLQVVNLGGLQIGSALPARTGLLVALPGHPAIVASDSPTAEPK